MNKPYNLQNIWAETDKSAIDVMTRKNYALPSISTVNDSDDGNSDLESLDSSYDPFVAVPKEFRPPLSVRTKPEHPQLSLNENKQMLSNKHPILIPKNIDEKTVRKHPLPENPKNEQHNIKITENTTSKCPLLEDAEFRAREYKKATNQIRNENTANYPQNLQGSRQDANYTTTAQKNIDEEKNPSVNRKVFRPCKKMANVPFQKQNEVLHRKEPKHENGNKEIKYEYIVRRGTIQLNFEMPTKRYDGLKMDSKEEIRNKERKKNPHTILYQENKVKWVSSLNLDQQNNDVEHITPQDFGKTTHQVSYQKNTFKWDNNLKGLNRETIIETKEDLNKKADKVFHQENAIKWDNSSKHIDTSTDTEGEIEWTIIQEKKTVISTKKVESKNHIHKQSNDEGLPRKHYPRNNRGKNNKHYRKNFNKHAEQPKNFHRKYFPKPEQKNIGNSAYEKKSRSNSNLKQERTHVENSNKQQEYCIGEEAFARQCRISEQNSDDDISPSLSKNKPRPMLNFASNKNGDYLKSDSYSEKIDNTVLMHLEEQKQSVLDYGREMSDLIIGSHTALSVFISTFKEWKQSRLELINQFENLEKDLKENSKKFTKYRDMLEFAKTSTTLAAAVPLPHVSVAARVISVLTGLFSAFLSTKEGKAAEIENSNDISIAAIRDTGASYDLYGAGLQCGLQFEDATKSIAEFHSNIEDPVIFEKESPEIADFIRGILEYKPRHRIFFRKLRQCFQELLQNCRSEFGKKFCEPFLLYSSDAVDVVEFLNWRFRHEDFNGESVRFELQEIERLIQKRDTSVKELAAKIRNCIGILQDELKFLEKCVKDLNLFEKSL